MKIYIRLTMIVAIMMMVIILFLTACGVQLKPAAAFPTAEVLATTEVAVAKQVLTPTSEIIPTETTQIEVEALRNATYNGIYDEPVILTDGKFEKSFEGQPYTVEYIDGTELFADLDGDGVEETIVFLVERGGGTAVFTYVVAQLNRNGQLVDAGAAMVEDRTQVRSATIQDGQVVLDITTRGPGDGDCCPSHKTRKVYSLVEGRLVEIPGEEQELEKISADDLNGTGWTLVELDAGTPVMADSEVTISFQEKQISGSGGCNSYTGSFSLGKDNPFTITISPVATSQKACPDPILNQESAFFSALEESSLWGYNFGRLVIAYPDGPGGELERMLFAPQESP